MYISRPLITYSDPCGHFISSVFMHILLNYCYLLMYWDLPQQIALRWWKLWFWKLHSFPTACPNDGFKEKDNPWSRYSPGNEAETSIRATSSLNFYLCSIWLPTLPYTFLLKTFPHYLSTNPQLQCAESWKQSPRQSLWIGNDNI